MENIYVVAVLCGLVFGAFIGRMVMKVKLALVYESRLKARKMLKAKGGV